MTIYGTSKSVGFTKHTCIYYKVLKGCNIRKHHQLFVFLLKTLLEIFDISRGQEKGAIL